VSFRAAFRHAGEDLYADQAARGWLAWPWLAPLLALVFIAGSNIGGSWLLHRARCLDARWNPRDPVELLAYLLVPFGLLWLVVGLWVRAVERRPLRAIGLSGPRPGRQFVAGLLVGCASMGAVVLVIALAGGYEVGTTAAAARAPRALALIVALLVGFSLQSSAEELVFRGWLLSVLCKRWNGLGAVVASSALFALLHYTRGQSWRVTVISVLFALFCCAWALRSRSVLGVMGWHSGWNWLNAVGFAQPLTGLDVGIPPLLLPLVPHGPDWLHGGAQGPEGSAACLAYFVLGLAWLLRRRGGAGRGAGAVLRA
jgi:uncharacterized protein (TIGR03382 family)